MQSEADRKSWQVIALRVEAERHALLRTVREGMIEWQAGRHGTAERALMSALGHDQPTRRNTMNEYAFDVKLRAAIRVNARTEDEARQLVRENMDAADCNGGAWPNGDPILFEASVDDEDMPCFEINGDPT